MRTDEFITRILPLKDNLLRVAFRITGDAERSEQIVQDVMLKVWNERSAWIVIEDLPSYCLMVARNMALETVNLRKIRTESFVVR
ncbi:MAG: RNA polymerase subunit sigma-70 [Parabacteroides sp.]|nr:RNA polymerase subunit sigma-70 [Parabacteroides sp.]